MSQLIKVRTEIFPLEVKLMTEIFNLPLTRRFT